MATKIKFPVESTDEPAPKSARELGETILRDQHRKNNEFFAEHQRRYSELVLSAAKGEEIDPEEFSSVCFHTGVDAEKWNADIASLEKRFELQKIASESDSRMAQAKAAEAKLDKLIVDRTAAWNAATAAIRDQEEVFRLAMRASDQCLEARDSLNRTRKTTAEEVELQKQLVGTDRCDGQTLLGHDDGLLDKIRACEMAIDPNANHRQPSYYALSCADFPAVVIRECEAELAKLQKHSVRPAADQVAKLRQRIVVAKGALELKKTELIVLKRQEAAIRQRQAELSAAANA